MKTRLALLTALVLVSSQGVTGTEHPANGGVSSVTQQTLDASEGRSIVYSRVPRTTATKTVKGEEIGNWAWMDALPEVARITSQFNAPGQLILRTASGQEKIIYDCTRQTRPCVPMDAMPSLDGKKIAFTVVSSDALSHAWPQNKKYPNLVLGNKGNRSQIHIYDIATETISAWPANTYHDIGPVWLPDGRIMFSSDRHRTFPPKLDRITTQPRQPRLYIANSDGSGVQDVSPHEVTGAMHPYVTDRGRVVYSSHWLSAGFPYKSTNGSINWPGTLANQWIIADVDLEGGDFSAQLGAHAGHMPAGKTSPLTKTRPSRTIKALHFLTQRTNGDLCTTNYYRNNNLGLGNVICWPYQGKGIEGPAPSFMPPVYYATAWGQSDDAKSKLFEGKYLGKVGYSEGAEDGQLYLSAGFGLCTTVARSIPKTNKAIGTDKDCDVGIYKTTRIPSLHPNDLERIVDRAEWHEFMPREIRPRTISTPALSKTADGSCEMASANANSTDAHFSGKYHFNKMYRMAANNGNEIVGLDETLAAVRFYEVLPNRSKKGHRRNSTGNALRLLGDVPLLADGSMKARLPCDTPFVMAGLDREGRIFKRDIIPQSLRPGEKRVCGGCHQHSKPPKRRYEKSLAFRAPAVDLTQSHPVPSYTDDVLPIVNKHCMGCHNDSSRLPLPLNDYQKLVWDFSQTHVPEQRRVQVSNSKKERRRYGLHRPQSSKYVNTLFARESLFYWKAINQRTDGRTDAQYDNDIDFGADHPTTLTAQELKVIEHWLDSGAQL